MILFLDDSTERAVLAYNRMPVDERDNCIWCKTAEEAMVTLWDYRDVLTKVYLDHDLGGEAFVNTKREDCGMEIIRFVENMSRKDPKEFEKLKKAEIIIHDWNGHAAPIMEKRLSALGLNAKWVPFGS